LELIKDKIQKRAKTRNCISKVQNRFVQQSAHHQLLKI